MWLATELRIQVFGLAITIEAGNWSESDQETERIRHLRCDCDRNSSTQCWKSKSSLSAVSFNQLNDAAQGSLRSAQSSSGLDVLSRGVAASGRVSLGSVRRAPTE